ncbi:MAG: hypothetical protein LBD14_02510 [Puniceicoccales bacterium]|jgi:hypothetical protein|nr:hypothetical protein [Puniceicoccales bacterium]
MKATTATHQPLAILRWNEHRLYIWSTAYAAAGLALPQLTHLVPHGGQIFLPLYLFTLIATLAHGWRAGLLTAVATPLLNHILFAMPPAIVLPPILAKSLLIVALCALPQRHLHKHPVTTLALIIFGYQILGGSLQWALTGNPAAIHQDITTGWPGLAIQLFAAVAVFYFFIKKQHSVPHPRTTVSRQA